MTVGLTEGDVESDSFYLLEGLVWGTRLPWGADGDELFLFR